jgi:RNA polymerase sigma-70 factor (ECF subfamily)
MARGEESALAELYLSTSGLVYGLVLRIVRDPATAEEVTLEVYLQAWRTAKSYQTGRGSVTAWLAIVARSRALDWRRSRQARGLRGSENIDELPEIADAAPSPEWTMVTSAQSHAVRRALNALPPEQRTAIGLGFYSGMSHAEIAEHLGLPLGTVKSRIRMGMSKLRELLGPTLEAA